MCDAFFIRSHGVFMRFLLRDVEGRKEHEDVWQREAEKVDGGNGYEVVVGDHVGHVHFRAHGIHGGGCEGVSSGDVGHGLELGRLKIKTRTRKLTHTPTSLFYSLRTLHSNTMSQERDESLSVVIAGSNSKVYTFGSLELNLASLRESLKAPLICTMPVGKANRSWGRLMLEAMRRHCSDSKRTKKAVPRVLVLGFLASSILCLG